MNIQTSYPIFESGQVLTSRHLNDLTEYLEQQDRRSRVALTGIGIVCGLEVDVLNGGSLVHVSKGVAVTSEGFLIDEPAGTYDRFREYEVPTPSGPEATPEAIAEARYPYLFPANGEQIKAWELLPTDFDPAPNEPAPTALGGGFLNDKTVMLFLECNLEALKNCDINDCSDKGSELQFTLRHLVVAKSDADAMLVRERQLAGRPVDRANHPRLGLPHLRVEKLSPGAFRIGSFQSLLARILTIAQRLSGVLPDALRKAYEAYAYLMDDMYPPSRFPNGPFPDAFFANVWGNLAGNVFLAQYFYDYMLDTVRAYNEFVECAARFDAECLPDPGRFPKHVLLGDAVAKPPAFGADLKSAADFAAYDPMSASTGVGPHPRPARRRTHFVPAPILAGQGDRLVELRSLFYRLTLLAHTYSTRDLLTAPIRITPSRDGAAPLSERAIPFHYAFKVESDLFRNWSYRKTRENLLSTVYSYQFSVPDGEHPLWFRLDDQDFYRIEGVVGKSLGTAMAELVAWKRALGLSFSIEPAWMRLAVSGDKDGEALDAAAAGRAMQAVRKLLLCRMRDLDVIFLMLMAALFAFLVWVIRSVGGQKVATFVPQATMTTAPTTAQPRALTTGEFRVTDFLAEGRISPTLFNLSVEEEAGLRKDSEELLVQLRKEPAGRETITKTLVKKPAADSVATLYDKVKDDTAGGDLFDRTRAAVKQMGGVRDADAAAPNVYATVSLLQKSEALMATLRAPSVAEFEVDSFSRAYRGFADAYADYAAKAPVDEATAGAEAARANATIVANAPTVAAQTAAFSTANIMAELQKRLLSMFQDLTLENMAAKHPGLEHKAGVPVGGTFVLVYAAKAEIESLIRKNIDAVKPAVGGARDGLKAPGFDFALDRALAELQKAAKSGADDPLDEFVVLADFCLPYACCDTDCSDVELSKRIAADPFGKLKTPGSMGQPPIMPGDPKVDPGRLRNDVTGGGGTIVIDTRGPVGPPPGGSTSPPVVAPVSPPIVQPSPPVVRQPSPPVVQPSPPVVVVGRGGTVPAVERRTGVVAGAVVVKDERGRARPVEGAVVVAVQADTGEEIKIKTENGRFEAELPVGDYKIRGTATGHRGSSQPVTVKPGTAVKLELEVTPTG